MARLRFLSVLLLFLACSSSISLAQSDDWNEPFETCGLKGSTTIYDYHKKLWMSSDIADSQVETLPASTFKIVNTLIALETKAVKDKDEIIPWIDHYDTLKYGHRPNIYHDMDMEEAFRLSAGWAYIEMAKRIGKERYDQILTDIGYGNGDLSIDDPDFWNFGSFGVSPVNQIETLIGIYEERFDFAPEHYKTLKKMMIAETEGDAVIRAKTGWTRADGKDTGWWVGYLTKENDEVYFFATRLIKPRSETNRKFGRCRKEITRKIFKKQGVL